jgi:very-short-patch-repair endonuclease
MSSWGEIALKNARKNDQIVVSDSAQPQKRQDLSKLLPEGSKHEVKFIRLWDSLGGPELKREVKFCPGKRYRADFLHAPTKLVIEIEGFGHQKSNRYKSDIRKYNAMAELGYILRRLTPDMINVIDIQEIIDFIRTKEAK